LKKNFSRQKKQGFRQVAGNDGATPHTHSFTQSACLWPGWILRGRTDVQQAVENAHLLRCATPAYEKYASFRVIACKQMSQTAPALHLRVFEQPV
jgi:hypothetical protein